LRRFSIVGSILLALTLLLISAGSAAPPPIRVDVPATTEATSLSATSVTYSVKAYDTSVDPAPAIAATCTGGSGSGDFSVTADFPLGNNSAQCSATLGDGTPVSQAFTVAVVDTTPPSFGPAPAVTEATTDPTGKAVSYPTPTATDLGESLTVNCSPASGSIFVVGTTQVDCSANDGRGNTGHVFFNVTVTLTDDQPPTFTPPLPSPPTTEATGPGGAAVSWTIAATDNIDPNPTINCNHPSGSTFAIGTTTVQCRATDDAGNFTDAPPFDVTVVDTTPPTLTVPGNQNVETEDPAGKAVTYSVTAFDIVSGSITPTCNHSSGDIFPIGTTAVHCTATDGAGKSSSGDFNVTVALVDHTPPVLSGYGDKTVEANGPAGSVVNFSTPTAVDAQDGPIGAVTCAPGSGSTFPLGTTAVNCSATDAHGNTGHATFNVTVRDTTPPTIYLPTAASIVATSVTGISSSDPAAQAYFQAVHAVDLIDAHPVVTYDVASHLAVGPNPVTFHARDGSGNESVLTTTLTVLPFGTPAPATPTPRTPPADVTNVKVTPLDGAVRIRWSAGGREVMVTRSTSATRSLSAVGDETVVYKGTASSYTDRGLTNGIEYRYVVMAVDAAGNHSAGVAVVVVPRRNLLKSPKDGARLKKAPKLLWALDSEAQYYNAQLLLNGKKILSVWPVRPAYKLKKSWKFEGRKYALKPGVYTWFVWPGYGARSAVDYGDLMGSRTFRIVR
jgi:HYR domain